MSVKKVLQEQLSLIRLDEEISKYLKSLTKDFTAALEKEIRKKRMNADVFVGGSFAKGTLVKKDKYDVDILVRFDWSYDNISDMVEKVLKKVCKDMKLKLERLHGSRDYFRAYMQNENSYFEVIPVAKIKRPQEEKNVTDLSYFHVPYVKKNIKGLEDDLLLAKTFCHAQKVYGAETYVQGFSGYALECLIIYYGSFIKMLRELTKGKSGERLVIDPMKHYKRKDEVFFELNENKLHGPIILIDPTYKERNALASLKQDTLERFQKAAKAFLKNPNRSFFVERPIDVEALKKRAKKSKAEFLRVRIKTDKQAGDIAGTKLKKFHYLLENEVRRYFKLIHHEFEYDENSPENSRMLGKRGLPSHDEKQSADVYMIARSKKEVIRIGPPLHMKKHVRRFKKEHRNTYEKNKFVHARIKVTFGAKEFVDVWKKQRANKKMMEEMGITSLVVK